MRRIAAFIGSLRGQIILLLTIGMSAAAFVALLISEDAQAHMFRRLRFQNVVASATDVAHRLDVDPERSMRLLTSDEILGARAPSPGLHVRDPEPLLTALLRERLGPTAAGQAVSGEQCFPIHRFNWRVMAAGIAQMPKSDCWLVEYRDRTGVQRNIAIGLPRFVLPSRMTLDPLYLVLIIGASALLGTLTAQIAASPLRRLTRAARTFSVASDPAPIPEEGPGEVRTAIATFNLMQRRVMEGLSERTQILAAISHDLQTPLTRIRLRLEQVQDEPLRERLVADLAAMHKLVREGLDLARSSESKEEWQVVDIDSLLASLAEDAAEFGADVRYVDGCGASVRTKPDALIRCLNNLVDNAVKYGGSAELRCVRSGSVLEIRIRDHGPGLPEEALERMFEPFVRLETSRSRATGGSGIGLTTARAQASLFGGTIRLRNAPGGGLLARVRLPI
ncbi:ATP-binding protein [Sphingomonas nostoxanthinifaciens]|uniref:ATP-binding protein n=1 Tax=Sphingomonas nostoxanthinifaciens TaxID=2872652 RepID=UPI001CC1ED2F|nr:ATP-binding protein [Sphingomonas nostoxanthinifaciens]UAK25066.1 HAMP domain-containing protein [Sphingomonas nostoxanthinifaciens]